MADSRVRDMREKGQACLRIFENGVATDRLTGTYDLRSKPEEVPVIRETTSLYPS